MEKINLRSNGSSTDLIEAKLDNVVFHEKDENYLPRQDAQYANNQDLAWAYLLNAKRFF